MNFYTCEVILVLLAKLMFELFQCKFEIFFESEDG